jgi:hypothetical protein
VFQAVEHLLGTAKALVSTTQGEKQNKRNLFPTDLVYKNYYKGFSFVRSVCVCMVFSEAK